MEDTQNIMLNTPQGCEGEITDRGFALANEIISILGEDERISKSYSEVYSRRPNKQEAAVECVKQVALFLFCRALENIGDDFGNDEIPWEYRLQQAIDFLQKYEVINGHITLPAPTTTQSINNEKGN